MTSQPALVDAAGTVHEPVRATPRIVSLVPSLTELLCDLNLAGALAGRTGFCIHPRETVRAIPKLGGTKSVRLDRLRALRPTHVVVNIDENEKPTVDEIARFVPHVIVTHPLDPRDNVALYRLFGGIFGREAQAVDLVERFERAWEALDRAAARFAPEDVLYVIWKKPWMTISRETYISRTLAAARWHTVPAESATRYPEIGIEDLLRSGVSRVLLASEPYPFRERDVAAFAREFPGAPAISLIDAEMTSWYGSRAIAGLGYLAELRRRLAAEAA